MINHDWSEPILHQCPVTTNSAPYKKSDTFLTQWWVSPKAEDGVHLVILLKKTVDRVCKAQRSRFTARMPRTFDSLVKIPSSSSINKSLTDSVDLKCKEFNDVGKKWFKIFLQYRNNWWKIKSTIYVQKSFLRILPQLVLRGKIKLDRHEYWAQSMKNIC